jgi:acyl transferase domain-containing protein
MEERLGFVVTSTEDLEAKLGAFASGAQDIEGSYRGRIEPGAEAAATTGWDSTTELMRKWATGFNPDWNKLYSGRTPQRISLPTYPFARERYWIDGAARDEEPASGPATAHDMELIEDILGRVADDSIEIDSAVEALKMLV